MQNSTSVSARCRQHSKLQRNSSDKLGEATPPTTVHTGPWHIVLTLELYDTRILKRVQAESCPSGWKMTPDIAFTQSDTSRGHWEFSLGGDRRSTIRMQCLPLRWRHRFQLIISQSFSTHCETTTRWLEPSMSLGLNAMYLVLSLEAYTDDLTSGLLDVWL